MDIYNDIKKATQISASYKSAEFVPLQYPGRGIRDRCMNKRNFPRPRNIELVEGDSDDSDKYPNMEEFLDEHRITSYIKSVNGGMDYSNQFLEHHWKMRQTDFSRQNPNNENVLLSDSSVSDTNCSDSVHVSQDDSNLKEREVQEPSTLDLDIADKVLSKSKYSRNALIKGLVKRNIITLADLDLHVFNNALGKLYLESSESKSSTAECLLPNKAYKRSTTFNKNSKYSDDTENTFDFTKSLRSQDQIVTSDSKQEEDYYRLNLVPHPDDPEFFAHPLQVYGTLGGTDLTVERIGKKKKVTPRQYFINDIDDSAFEFVRKKPQIDDDELKENTK